MSSVRTTEGLTSAYGTADRVAKYGQSFVDFPDTTRSSISMGSAC